MTKGDDQIGGPGPETAGAARDARLKAALKANMARRKAQARARRDGAAPRNDKTAEPDPGEDGQQ